MQAARARAYRLLYPVVDRVELRATPTSRSDPALVAGLIRQESSFGAGGVGRRARGLMQVLPAVGEEISRSLKYPVWSPALLLDADGIQFDVERQLDAGWLSSL
jgi:soluble lytic murein transglycosylase-like protein